MRGKTQKTNGNPREAAYQILYKVATEGTYANLAVRQKLKESDLSPEDSRLMTELVYGTLRQQGSLDYILSQFVKSGLDKISSQTRVILRLGLYQLWYMDRIPVFAAVNESVNLAKKYGHAGIAKLVNGVLRSIDRERTRITFPSLAKDVVGHITYFYSHPRWLVERWIKQFGVQATIELCKYDNAPANFCLRINTLKSSREDVLALCEKSGLVAKPGLFAPESIYLSGLLGLEKSQIFQQGLVQPQDESSMLAALALCPSPGAKVLDLCAAPGGKTTHLAQLMKNQGRINAFDIHPHKIGLIKENCRRLGITIVDAKVQDATRLPEALRDWADYVLVDAPCSGLGVLGRRPDSRWHKEPKIIEEMAVLGSQILAEAAKTVRPGGFLLYSTCTIGPEENQQVIENFLQNQPGWHLTELPTYAAMNETDKQAAKCGMWQILPQVHGMDGFFMARLVRGEN